MIEKVIVIAEQLGVMARQAAPAAEFAPRLAEEATLLLSKSAALAGKNEAVPALIERLSGLAGASERTSAASGLARVGAAELSGGLRAGGAAQDLLLVGKPLPEQVAQTLGASFKPAPATMASAENMQLAVYERNRNLYLLNDGSLRVASPNCAGTQLRIETFNAAGESVDLKYAPHLRDYFGTVANPSKAEAKLPAEIVTTPTSRRFVIGGAEGTNKLSLSATSFGPAPEVWSAAASARPLHPMSSIVESYLGRHVSTPGMPISSGALIGFDARAGEALVAHTGGPVFAPTPIKTVSALRNLVPVTIKSSYDAAPITAFRSHMGELFRSEPTKYGAFKLYPAHFVSAYAPAEVNLGSLNLAECLNISKTAGIRAQGGFPTRIGGRVSIF
jgi:hypothetical protein